MRPLPELRLSPPESFKIMKRIRFAFVVLLTTFLPMGCGFFPTPNPLKGWQGGQTAYRGCPFEKAICDDYREYIRSLPESERSRVTDLGVEFYEKGPNQRAVAITIAKNGKYLTHLLTYENNRRIRVK